jgi:hypothetical protein
MSLVVAIMASHFHNLTFLLWNNPCVVADFVAVEALNSYKWVFSQKIQTKLKHVTNKHRLD